MSILESRKKCFDIVDRFPESQLFNLVVSLEDPFRMTSEDSDDKYCLELYRSSFNEENADPISFIEFAKELG